MYTCIQKYGYCNNLYIFVIIRFDILFNLFESNFEIQSKV